MKVLAVLVSCLILMVVGYSSADQIWQPCTGEINPTFKINSLTVTPNPPLIGKTCTINLEGSLGQEVTEGKSKFMAEYFIGGGWRPIPTFTNEICKIVKCPVAAGPFSFNTSLSIPFLTPHGQYKGTLTLVDQAQRNVTCLTFATTLNTK